MSSRYDCTDPDQREAGLRHARDAISRGELVVVPTDTVQGLAADAFSASAVASLLAAKGRGRAMPPPVLMASERTLDGLATDVPGTARALAERFWPGALTLVCRAQPSLQWDLGDTGGTVAVRVPDHPIARALLAATGPLAVSSANLTGHPAATTTDEAMGQLGDVVAAYLDDGSGPREVAPPSTIVDATGPVLRVLREGALGLRLLREVAPDLLGIGEEYGDVPHEENAGPVATGPGLVFGTAPEEPTTEGSTPEESVDGAPGGTA